MVHDYSRSTLNMMASVFRNFGGVPAHGILEELEGLNQGEYDHVILMVFDGMGQDTVDRFAGELNLPGGFSNLTVKTVFPPTTAAAMTSLYTGESPAEHGYLGWSLWYEEYQDRYINVLPGTDSSNNRSFYGEPLDIYDLMPVRSFSEKLSRLDDAPDLYFICPRAFVKSRYNIAARGTAKMVPYRRFKDMIRAAASSVRKSRKGKSFTMVYNMDPDHFLHPEGMETGHLGDFMTLLGEQLRKLTRRLEGSNTLLIVTADHGMTSMTDYFMINEDHELFDSLVRPPFPESRFLSFHVKPGEKESFRERFLSLLGDDFLLLEGEEFLKQGWLGPVRTPGTGERAPRLVGDFVAIAKGKRGVKYYSEKGGKSSPPFKAHHAGMTEREMNVPLLLYSAREEPSSMA